MIEYLASGWGLYWATLIGWNAAFHVSIWVMRKRRAKLREEVQNSL